jgi:hypothetical protein
LVPSSQWSVNATPTVHQMQSSSGLAQLRSMPLAVETCSTCCHRDPKLVLVLLQVRVKTIEEAIDHTNANNLALQVR